jgi:ABC-type glycerol-3-phosphate transport system substrate-binding protein
MLLMLVVAVVVPFLYAGGGGEQKPAGASSGPTKILWWSHWANEGSKREVIETIKKDYMAAHPNVEIELVWWDKNPLQDAWRVAMTAGSQAPDIVTDPAENAIPQIESGWFSTLGDDFPWKNFKEGAKEAARFGNIPGEYKYNIGQNINMILYNKEIFNQIGVTVPADYTFTQSEWADITRKLKTAGYSGAANAAGNRPYTAALQIYFTLFSMVGGEEAFKYINGLKSWDTQEARKVLQFSLDLTKDGFWPGSVATMGIDEFHIYFHTQKRAATFWIPSFYTGRAFKPEAEGGQSPNFRFGMLRYPKMDGGVAHDRVIGSYESGYMISGATKHLDTARDILRFASQPKYGAVWEILTDSPSCIIYQDGDIPSELPPSKWKWYHDEIAKVYGSLKMETVELLAPPQRTGDFNAAAEAVLNQGIPMGLVTVDEAVKKLDAAIKK